MKRFMKIVNGYIFLRKLQLYSRYQLFTFSNLWNKYYDLLNASLMVCFWSIYSNFIKYGGQGGRMTGAVNFDIPWNFVKEQLLHNLMKYFSGPSANQIVMQ